jgi:hypothetical protein
LKSLTETRLLLYIRDSEKDSWRQAWPALAKTHSSFHSADYTSHTNQTITSLRYRDCNLLQLAFL